MEGCVINDNMGVFADGGNNNVEAYLLNCNITGTLGNVDNGILSNSIIQSTPALNKLLVNIKSGVPTVLIDGAPDPYPQFLVKH